MSIEKKLEASRKDLLELGLRNPLINFRKLKKGVEVIDELSTEIYRILVEEQRQMSFVALPKSKAEALEEAGEEEADWAALLSDGEEPEEDGLAARHTDDKLQTRLRSENLSARLLQIHSLARTVLGETGVNTLYLALGFVRWYESESAQEARSAPLVVVPVELKRSDARERFKVAWTHEDVGDNLSLQAKLKNEFGIDLPPLTDDSDDEFNLSEYFDLVEKAIANQSRWSVERDEIHLCFLSFGKFLMYKDLDPKSWPDPDAAAQHPVLSALLGEGFSEPAPKFSESDHLDRHLKPDDVNCVVDADSTQLLAVLDANSGRNLVIEGPPGTGKSQTITNVVAEAVGQGRKVLFVSEKMAALEVVKRRLDSVGLGDAVLELHSHKANKRAVLQELKRTLALGRPEIEDASDDLRTLIRSRERLNDYCDAINDPLEPSAVRPIDALGRLLEFRDNGAELPRFDFAEMRDWTSADYKDRRAIVGEMATKLDQMGCPKDNPFWGTTLTVFNPIEEGRIRNALEAALHDCQAVADAAAELARALDLDAPLSPEDAGVICRAASRAIGAPHQIGGVQLNTGDWQARRDDLGKLVEAGGRIAAVQSQYGDVLIEEAWEQDLLEVRQHLAAYGDKWWRLFSGNFRRARSRLTGLCRGRLPKANADCLKLVDAVMEVRRNRKVFEQYQALGESLFRAQWQGLQSDWQVLATLVDWIVELYRDVGDGQLPRGLIDFLAGDPRVDGLQEKVTAVNSLLEKQERSAAAAADILGLAAGGEAAEGLPAGFSDRQARLALWLERLQDLQRMAEFNLLAKELRDAGMASGAARAAGWRNDGEEFLAAFDWTWYEGQFDRAYRTREPLQRFDRTTHEHAVATFRDLDTLLLKHVRGRLMMQHWKALPQMGGGGELAVIRTEINKKRRHLPIRELMNRAGRALQAIKPVFMMSPMSVATFIPPGRVEFDLVVFDEASQVTPVDALGALLRGRQAVVVGDSKQMPPTSFFDSLYAPEEVEEDNTTADQESVLGLFSSQGAPSRMLRWHYRSRHESLIAVSNHEFYDDRLVIFPSPGIHPQARGLVFHHLEHTHYERGRSRTNPEEALAVAHRVIEHAKKTPHLTLGVVAFSMAQRDAIEMQLEALRRRDPSVEEFFNEQTEEPFIIKNLENVQGDERDVIFISIGYGKTREGYLAHSFGPLNAEGGERRLNVLVTRARMACEVFANFCGDDIDLNRSRARGVAALKNFLTYAKDRVLLTAEPTGKEPDSPFEEAVIRRLRQSGYEVEPQVGCNGFYIDIGVRDPEKPGRYILGIECDGATYHSARSARDRDRLREQVLRGLGWEIHRIWSTDWFRNPDAEFTRLEEALAKAKVAVTRKEAQSETPSESAAPAPNVDLEVVRAEPGEAKPPAPENVYQKAELSIHLGGNDLHAVPADRMAEWVAEVVKCESPVHNSEVQARITAAAGLKRTGRRIRDAVDAGIARAVTKKTVRRNGVFLWSPDMTKPAVRDRSALESADKKLDMVSAEEIREALSKAVELGFSLSQEDAVSEALRLLGFQRVTSQAKERLEVQVEALIEQGELKLQGGFLAAS